MKMVTKIPLWKQMHYDLESDYQKYLRNQFTKAFPEKEKYLKK